VTSLAALAAAGLLARLLAAAPPAPAGDVQIEGEVSYNPGTGRLVVEDGAVLRRGDVVVRARSATYDPATGEVSAVGNVLLTDATRVVAADAIRVVLGGDFEAEGVVAFVKDAPVDLGAGAGVEEARRAGRNRLSFSGPRLEGDSAGRFRLHDARLTLCDCPDGGAPSWEVTARKADVVPGRRAILSWPVLRVTPRFLLVDRPVPVLVLPWLYLPLADRQTGLLLPEIRSVEATGLALAQPLFVTLGRSADATLTAEYAFGRSRADVAAGAPAVRGPGARLELRWAPAAGAEGRAEVAWVHDLDDEPRITTTGPGGEVVEVRRPGASGDRLAIEGRHAQALSDRTALHASLRLTSDPLWVRDFARSASDIGGTLPYQRSDVLLSRRGDALVLEVGASYLQPLRPAGYVGGEDSGIFGAGLDAASRWPAAAATVVPLGVGPLRLSGRAGAARFAPVSGAFDRSTADEGTRRPAAARADAALELALPLLLGRAVSLAPYVRGAAAGYAYDADRDAEGSAWAVAGAVLGTEVSRRFGRVRHAIAPRLEWRAGTDVAGDRLGWLAYDALDRAGIGSLASGPAGPWQQLRAAVETRLAGERGDLARLELAQDLDLRSGRFAETSVAAGLALGRVSFDGAARFFAIDARGEDVALPPQILPARFLDRFTELRAAVAVSDRRGDALSAGFFATGAGGSGALLAGLDPLFDVRAAPLPASAYAGLSARVVAGGATLGYEARFPGRARLDETCAGGGTRRLEGWEVEEHVATFVWDSPCRCFRIAASVGVDDCGELTSYGASIDVSRLAGAAFGR
jgi:LPS-assembly protein